MLRLVHLLAPDQVLDQSVALTLLDLRLRDPIQPFLIILLLQFLLPSLLQRLEIIMQQQRGHQFFQSL